MKTPATVRVKATHEASQGPFVVINESDFDPAVHKLFDAPDQQSSATVEPAKPKRRGRQPRNPSPE